MPENPWNEQTDNLVKLRTYKDGATAVFINGQNVTFSPSLVKKAYGHVAPTSEGEWAIARNIPDISYVQYKRNVVEQFSTTDYDEITVNIHAVKTLWAGKEGNDSGLRISIPEAELIDGKEVLKRTGASATQLEYFVRVGIVVPAKPAPRRGMCRLYSPSNVKTVKRAMELSLLHKKSIIASLVGRPDA